LTERRLQLAVVHGQNEEYDESVDQFLGVIELDPKRGMTYFMLGHVYILKGDFLDAEAAFSRQLLELNPAYIDNGKAKKQLRKIEKGR